MNDWSLKSDFLNPLRFSFPFPSPSVLQSNSQKKPCVMWQQSCRMFVRIMQKLCSHQSFCSQHSDLFEIQPTIKCNVSLRLIRLSNFCVFFLKSVRFCSPNELSPWRIHLVFLQNILITFSFSNLIIRHFSGLLGFFLASVSIEWSKLF